MRDFMNEEEKSKVEFEKSKSAFVYCRYLLCIIFMMNNKTHAIYHKIPFETR